MRTEAVGSGGIGFFSACIIFLVNAGNLSNRLASGRIGLEKADACPPENYGTRRGTG